VSEFIYSVAKTPKMPYFYRSFPAKMFIMSDPCVERDVQLKASSASSPPSIYDAYGVATVSRIDKIIGLFCKRAL